MSFCKLGSLQSVFFVRPLVDFLLDLLEFEVLMCVWMVNEDVRCLAERFTTAGALSMMENAAKFCVCVFEMKQ